MIPFGMILFDRRMVAALGFALCLPLASAAQEVVSRTALPTSMADQPLTQTPAPELAPQIVLPVGMAEAARSPVTPEVSPPAEPVPLIVLTSEPVSRQAPPAANPEAQATGLAPLIDLGLTPVSAPLAEMGKLGATDGPLSGQAMAQIPPPPPAAPPSEWLMPLILTPGAAEPGVHIGAGLSQPGIVRLTGEVADIEMRVTLPAGAASSLPLILSLRSSVNNLPEASQIAVRVNGADAGSVRMDGIGPFVDHKIELTGLLPGVNLIRLSAHQTHRIFCGPEASFGIWTEINLGQSGIPIAPFLLPLDASGLVSALQSQGAGDRPIEILADEYADEALIRAVSRQLGDALGFVPRVNVLPFYSETSDPTAKARIALIPGPEARATIRRGAGDATVLQIEYVGDVLPDLSTVLPLWNDSAPIASLTPGLKTPISALGTPQIIGNTRYFRRDVNFLLPDDWLLLASQKAEFEILYGFAAGLPKGGLLLFKVNGQTVRLLPLDEKGGKILPPLRISFGASRLHAGVNTLTFEVSVPGDPTDMPCMARDTDMLAILGDSSITVPRTPSMHQGDVARSLALLDGADVTIPPSGLATDAAQARDTLIAFETRFRPLMSAPLRPVLHVVGMDGVGLIPVGQTEVSRRALQYAVSWRAAPQPLAAVAKPTSGAEPFRLSVVDLEMLDAVPAAPAEDTSIMGQVFGVFSADGWISMTADRFYNAAFPGAVPLTEWIAQNQGQALLLQLDPKMPNDIWLLAGPELTMADLVQKLDTFRRDGSHGATAQAAVLRADGSWAMWSMNPSPRLLESLSLRNLRDVLGNYASWSPALFTSLSFLFAILSVIPALVFVLITRRPGSRT